MIPLTHLRAQVPKVRAEANEALARVVDSAKFVLGKEVDGFEALFAGYCEATDAIATNTGASALHFALLAIGIDTKDDVIGDLPKTEPGCDRTLSLPLYPELSGGSRLHIVCSIQDYGTTQAQCGT